MKKILIIIGILFAALASIGVLAGLWIFTAKELPLSEVDERILVTANDLSAYFEHFTPQEDFETSKRLKYFDGSQELTYEYDSQLDEEPYINTTITYDVKASDALFTYKIEWTAQALTYKVYDMTLEENSTFYNPDGKSKFGDIVYDGEILGHIFIYQKENTTLAFTMAGFVMTDPQIWHELFDHRIENL